MVKIQKHFAYNYKGKDHYKHQIIIPEDVVEQLGWKEGNNVEVSVNKDTLVVKRKKEEK